MEISFQEIIVQLGGIKVRFNKSTFMNLRSIYEKDITINYISEKLIVCKPEDDALKTRKILEESDLDIIGVEDKDVVIGYINRDKMGAGLCQDYIELFKPFDLVSDSTPLIDLFQIFKKNSRVFVLNRNRVIGIITLADLQKPPITMLLFGLISILETNMLNIIRLHYPNNAWEKHISIGRASKAKELYELRLQRNEALDLADCLQLSDKIDLIIKDKDLRERMGYKSKKELEKLLKPIEYLRNRLAHSQDIVNGTSWKEIFEIIESIEQLLIKSENIIKDMF